MILINVSNLSKGGGIQFAQSVIEELEELGINFEILLREDQRSLFNYPKVEQFVLRSKYSICRFFARNIYSYSKYNAVYSVFGPSYIYGIASKHFVGFAQGWSINLSSIAYGSMKPSQRLVKRIDAIIKLFITYFEARTFFVETDLVKAKLKQFYKFRSIEVLYNTSRFLPLTNNNRSLDFNKVLYVANYYPHKNHRFLLEVAARMPHKEFYITLSKRELDTISCTVPRNVTNIGRLDKYNLEKIYLEVGICFIPSLLESFSAAFVEAMAFRLPIVAQNLDFVYDICGSSAFTFDGIDNCCEVIENMDNLWSINGKIVLQEYDELLARYGSPIDRVRRIINLISIK